MLGPNRRTDARHRITRERDDAAAVGFRVAPIFIFRSALPVYLGRRRRPEPGRRAERPAGARGRVRRLRQQRRREDSRTSAPATTINCGRGAAFSQLNLRVSRTFHLFGRANVEAIGEIFNLFNAINPANIESTISGVVQTVRLVDGAPNPSLHAADALRGRLPAARTARGADRVPLHVLTLGKAGINSQLRNAQLPSNRLNSQLGVGSCHRLSAVAAANNRRR